jgi:hypothetical protein
MRNRFNSPATCGQSFLAVDWLIERYGITSLHAFLRRFAADADRGARWPRFCQHLRVITR